MFGASVVVIRVILAVMSEEGVASDAPGLPLTS